MNIIILDEAHSELVNAIDFYENKSCDLGLKLKDEIDKYVKWVTQKYNAPRLRKGLYRRVNLKIFLYYIVRKNSIWILVIAHFQIRPEYWTQRKNNIFLRQAEIFE